MKIRNGFVSNSSSSSFIVYDKNVEPEDIPDTAFIKKNDREYILNIPFSTASYEFGWEDRSYTGVLSKINFTIIQIKETKQASVQAERLKMLKYVITKNFKKTHSSDCTLDIIVNEEAFIFNSNFYAYIDHQSSALEGENEEMFDSIEDLEEFLFNINTYIQGGNDNDIYYDEE